MSPALKRAALLLLAGWVCPIRAFPEVLPLPPRATNAPSASAILQQVAGLNLAEREAVIVDQILAGNVPDFLRKLCPVEVTNTTAAATTIARFYATPDYLAIGSDENYFLAPLSPMAAQRIATTLNCSLPTRKMVDAIYRSASVKLAPQPIAPSAAMTTVAVFSNHNAQVRAQRNTWLGRYPLGSLVAGHKKDVVLTARLAVSPGKVAIYGWHQTNGAPIQPLYLGHTANWVDYSQCTRLVQARMQVNGRPELISEVLANPTTAALLSDEGPLTNSAYSTNSVAEAPSIASRTDSALSAVWITNSLSAERVLLFRANSDVAVTLNSPLPDAFADGKKILLIYYALPNGNTTAQTAGKVLKPGDDWHYDIQHIAAQTRFLRQALTNRTVVVAYLENDLQSWPAWRKKHGDASIPGLLARIKEVLGLRPSEVVLASHSGGGSLVFGYLNTVEHIPQEIVRIAFLDSTYAYNTSLHHARKLAQWLQSPEPHYLCVLAYNDAVALLDGKSFVSASGGTWGRSHQMQKDLAEFFPFERQANSEFERFTALSGRVQFLLKENPERKILHTLQVERNGFIHSVLMGTALENQGYEYYGSRAYSRWIQE